MNDASVIERIKWDLGELDPAIITKPETFETAAKLCGGSGQFRIRGGRTIYESIGAADSNRSDRVRLMRLSDDDPSGRLRQVDRWVDPETEIEVFEVDVWTAHFAGWCGMIEYTEDGVAYVDGVDVNVPGRVSR